MQIYEAMYRAIQGCTNREGGHTSDEIRSTCEAIVLAWIEIPEEWQKKLCAAAFEAFKHFGLTMNPDYGPRQWVIDLINLHAGTYPKTA